ncbi:MAG TPA: NYN domain-containing protein [Pyrinomonadaceae bacterium]|nr:NYN domain-containing protein [Pyrinomonadaceae bacterium]
MQELKETEKIALFVDVENFIGFSYALRLPIDLAPVIKKLTETGRVLFRRSFGDLNQSLGATQQYNRLHHVRQMLQRNLVQHEDVPYDSKYKNSSDIRLAVEALSIAFRHPDITTFAVVASDRDYIPLFAKLRELGKNVTGISGNPTTVRDRYITACDAIFYVEDLYKAESALLGEAADAGVVAEPVSESYLREQYLDLLVRAVSSLSEQGRKTIGASIVPRMRQMQSDFDVSRAGFSSFKEFVAIAEEAGLISTRWQGYDILVTLPSAATTETTTESSTELVKSGSAEEYRRFVEGKLRVPLPPRDLRGRIYKTTAEVLNDEELSIGLNDLSHDVADELLAQEITITQPAAFKLLYSLYRAGCFIVEPGPSSFDPQVLGVKHGTETWDEKFIDNMLYLMNKEMKDTAFVHKNLSSLFYEDEEKADAIARKLADLQVEAATG